MAKKALITGVTGQDGSYLTEFLLAKGYEVHGLRRRSASFNEERISHIKSDNFFLHYADLTDGGNLLRIIKEIEPDEIYNLAAQSHVAISWDIPEYTINTDGLGVVRILEIIRALGLEKKTKFYQASTSELFSGKLGEAPQNEETVLQPQTPYALGKLLGFWAVRVYRKAFGIFACNGILFNHEGPRRGENFVTRKISLAAARISLGLQEKLYLGNLDAKRDWGHARDYCIDLTTSVLTETGFRYYDEINTGDIVLNFNTKTNRLERDQVIKKILLKNTGRMYLFLGRGVKLRCSANHRIFYQSKSKTSKGGWSNWKVCEAKDFYRMVKDSKLRTKYDYRLPHVQGYKNKNLKVKNEWFKLIGYLVSEGSLCDDNRCLTVSVSQSKIINSKVYKDMICTFKKLSLYYRTRERADGVVEFVFNSRSSKKIISYFDSFDIHKIPKWMYKAGDRQLRILFEAMMDGDGSWGVMTYVSKRKDLIFDFQTIATILGYRTIIHQRQSGMWECVMIASRKKHFYVTDLSEEDSNEKVWCVTTKNGTIVTNKDGGIAVSGNCEAMWLMLQQSEPDDYIIATGETRSVREFCEIAFLEAGIELEWQGEGVEEKGMDKKSGKIVVNVDPQFFRPAEVESLCGDSTKAKEKLGWHPKISFRQLVQEMVQSDLVLAKKELCLKKEGFLK